MNRGMNDSTRLNQSRLDSPSLSLHFSSFSTSPSHSLIHSFTVASLSLSFFFTHMSPLRLLIVAVATLIAAVTAQPLGGPCK